MPEVRLTWFYVLRIQVVEIDALWNDWLCLEIARTPISKIWYMYVMIFSFWEAYGGALLVQNLEIP